VVLRGDYFKSIDLLGDAVGKGGFEAVMQVWHCVLAPLATVLEYLVRVLDGQAGRRRAPAAATLE
jgi:hypothetical protein